MIDTARCDLTLPYMTDKDWFLLNTHKSKSKRKATRRDATRRGAYVIRSLTCRGARGSKRPGRSCAGRSERARLAQAAVRGTPVKNRQGRAGNLRVSRKPLGFTQITDALSTSRRGRGRRTPTLTPTQQACKNSQDPPPWQRTTHAPCTEEAEGPPVASNRRGSSPRLPP